MQVPYRKPTKFSHIKFDPLITKAKFAEMTRKLEKLKKSQPQVASEVARLAELGDFSENVEYQLAKGRLRGINNAIMMLEAQLNQAEIIDPKGNADRVDLGRTVTVEVDGKQKTFTILGSAETNPEKGIISHSSPLGAVLLGKKVGKIVKVKLADREAEYKIVEIK